MTTDEALELLDKIRNRWRTSELTDTEHVAWRAELALVEFHPAHETLSQLYRTSPHRRPTVAQFTEHIHTLTNPNKLSPAQIELNLAGIARLREQWNNRHATTMENR